MLVLLYADPNGDLRVVITIRAKTLSSCTYLDRPCFQGAADVLHDMPVALTCSPPFWGCISDAGEAALPGGTFRIDIKRNERMKKKGETQKERRRRKNRKINRAAYPK